jgi:hypothetical protein
MIDLGTEEILTLAQGAKFAHTSFCSIWRWVMKGLPDSDGQRVRLRAGKLGGHWITSKEAIQEFMELITPKFGDSSSTPRSPSARRRASEKAAKALELMGVK